MKANLYDTLKERGFVFQDTGPALREHLAAGPITCYAGFDPTADSLHVGHLVAIMALKQAQLHGHRPIAVAGGATGMVGDPSGKSAERQLLDDETLHRNLEGIRSDLSRFLDFSQDRAFLVNNADWMGRFTAIEFLRDVGKHFTVNYMVAKESIRMRMEDREHGLSFTEFSYMLFQAYDFYHLHDRYGCTLQIGGSEQWGNITAGIELIRRKKGGEAHGLTFPLITDSSGKKFGKSEGNAVWLSPRRTSPDHFYQYFMQREDADIARFLYVFTVLSREAIADIVEKHAARPEARTGQRVLAREVTSLVHGASATEAVDKASRLLFGETVEGLTDQVLEEVGGDLPPYAWSRSGLEEGMTVLALAHAGGLVSSKNEGRNLIGQGGLYLNNRRVEGPEQQVASSDLLTPHYLLLRAGKKKYLLVKIP